MRTDLYCVAINPHNNLTIGYVLGNLIGLIGSPHSVLICSWTSKPVIEFTNHHRRHAMSTPIPVPFFSVSWSVFPCPQLASMDSSCHSSSRAVTHCFTAAEICEGSNFGSHKCHSLAGHVINRDVPFAAFCPLFHTQCNIISIIIFWYTPKDWRNKTVNLQMWF